MVDELYLNSTNKNSKLLRNKGRFCGLPAFSIFTRRRRWLQAAHASGAVHSLPDHVCFCSLKRQEEAGEHRAAADVAGRSEERCCQKTQQAAHASGAVHSLPDHVCFRSLKRQEEAGEHRAAADVAGRSEECCCQKTQHLHMFVSQCKPEDPLHALLHHNCHPLANLDDTQKLAWLRSHLVGVNQEILTPFGLRQLVYADHTASGRSLFYIENFITQHVLPFYGNTHTDDSYVGSRTSWTMKEAEEYVKARLGGSKEDVLLMCGWGCTAAIKRLQEVMGIAVPSILRKQVLDTIQRSIAKEERWLVFVGPYEHHSNLLTWRQSLAEVREIPTNEEGMIDMERLEAELQAAQMAGQRKMLGAFSACSNVTGLLTNTRAIALLLHRYGALVCFDFAAAASHMRLEMRSSEEDGCDVMVMSPHKLLGGPGSPGLLLMKKSLYKLEKNPPSTCGGGTVAYVNGFNEEDTLYYEKIEEREEGGTPPILGKVRCALAFWLKEAMGMALITQREGSYLEKATVRLSIHPNIEVLGHHPSNGVAPILSFLITPKYRTSSSSMGKPLHGRFVVKLLNDLFGIQARGGCACAGPYGHLLLGIGKELSLAIRNAIQKGYEGVKPGWTRLSLCYSMTEEEVEYMLSAVALLGSYGHRFLWLYDFDWRSGNWTLSEEKARGLLALGTPQRIDTSSLIAPDSERENRPTQRQHFYHNMQHARALVHLLPHASTASRPIPPDLDPALLVFQI